MENAMQIEAVQSTPFAAVVDRPLPRLCTPR